jgi:toxin-antitoxin system PIN domain toxin
VIAVDTNVLVYAHIDTFDKHELARSALVGLAERGRPWGIPAPCLVEFVRVMTHPRILAEPLSVADAVAAMDAVLTAPSVSVLCPAEQHWPFLSETARDGDARGNLAFDAVIAAICQEVGVTLLLTEDRDFDRFSRVAVARLADFEP